MSEKKKEPEIRDGQPTAGAITEQAREFVLRLFGQRQDGRLLVHNYNFADTLAGYVKAIAKEEGAGAEVLEQALLGAWFIPTGYLYDYREPAHFSVEFTRQFFGQAEYPAEKQEQVVGCILSVAEGRLLSGAAERILSDAIQATTYLQGTEDGLPLLRLEREFLLGRKYTKVEWSRGLLEELLRIKLHTHSAQARFQPLLAQAIHNCRQVLEKHNKKAEEEDDGSFISLERKVPVRGVQTFFRANYRNHINLSAIADNKANIMISVNTILVSVLITFLSYRNIGENSPQILLPVVIFLVTGMASLIFAVLSARPKVTMLNPEGAAPEAVRRNVVFFGNFVTLSLEQFEEAMEDVFNDSELLYGNMVRDLYHLGKVLEKKYRYLAISYNIFMAGFIATVCTFLIALFT
ncbi:MAG: hypothetical protein H6560_17540 [Lewinellaceae bacterium]|nr:hypothetical protein [Lewinellaceae bacterium]